MSVDVVQPALSLQAVQPKPENHRQSGRPRPGDKSGKAPADTSDEAPPCVRNALGQLTGLTINVTA